MHDGQRRGILKEKSERLQSPSFVVAVAAAIVAAQLPSSEGENSFCFVVAIPWCSGCLFFEPGCFWAIF